MASDAVPSPQQRHRPRDINALARVKGYTVVTLETMAASNERTRIPNVCAKYGIPCIDLIGLMDAEGWTF